MEDTRSVPDVGTPAGTRLDTPQRDLGEILERLLDEAEGEGSSAPPPPPSGSAVPPASADAGATVTGDTAVPVSAPASEGGISPLAGLLSNPAILQALPQLMSSLGPLLNGVGQKTQALPASKESIPASGSPAPKTVIPVDRHTALLCAIKPYLGRERQQAAEHLISLCRVFSTLQSMGVSLPMLMSAFTGGNGQGTHEDKEV